MSPSSIAGELRRSLLSGQLRPGAELSQVALAEQFGVSRIPIREALRVLEGEGLVEIEPNRGAKAVTLSPAEVKELYELRMMLECDLLRRAMSCVTGPQLDEIERVRRRSDLDATTPRWSEGDMAFHSELYRHAGRGRQLAIVEGLRRTCQLYVAAYSSMPSKTPRWLADHRSIVHLMRAGDVDGALSALGDHISAAMHHLLDRMNAVAVRCD